MEINIDWLTSVEADTCKNWSNQKFGYCLINPSAKTKISDFPEINYSLILNMPHSAEIAQFLVGVSIKNLWIRVGNINPVRGWEQPWTLVYDTLITQSEISSLQQKLTG